MQFLRTEKHGDFNPEWFEDVGSTILTIFICCSFYPILENAYRFLDNQYTLLKDRGVAGYCCNRNETKCKTISDYIKVNSGPEF